MGGFIHDSGVKLGVEGEDMIRALAVRDKTFLGGGNKTIDCGSNGEGDGFSQNPIIGVIDCDRSSTINGCRGGFGDKVEETRVERGGGLIPLERRRRIG